MLARFVLWLAVLTDRWAQRLNDRPLEVWHVDGGTLTPITEGQLRWQAMNRHPAGTKLRQAN